MIVDAGESILQRIVTATRPFKLRGIVPVFAVMGLNVYEHLCAEIDAFMLMRTSPPTERRERRERFPPKVAGLQIVVIDSPDALFIAPATSTAFLMPPCDPEPPAHHMIVSAAFRRCPDLPPSDHGIDGAHLLPPAAEWEIPPADGPAWSEQNRRINDLLEGRA